VASPGSSWPCPPCRRAHNRDTHDPFQRSIRALPTTIIAGSSQCTLPSPRVRKARTSDKPLRCCPPASAGRGPGPGKCKPPIDSRRGSDSGGKFAVGQGLGVGQGLDGLHHARLPILDASLPYFYSVTKKKKKCRWLRRSGMRESSFRCGIGIAAANPA
jgi:hypothetical protein